MSKGCMVPLEPTAEDLERLMPALDPLRPYFLDTAAQYRHTIARALVDAIFSIEAVYRTRTGKGVGANVEALAEQLQTGSLDELLSLGTEGIQAYMGTGRLAPGKKGSISKAEGVVQVARAWQALGVNTVEDFLQVDRGTLRRCYTNVYGLGAVTFDYFLMLIGVDGIKADRQVLGFLKDALGHEVTPAQALALLEQARDRLQPDMSLVQLDHTIWRYASGALNPKQC